LQDEYDSFIVIADIQALTDNFNNPEKVRKNVYELTMDYLAS
jgi:tryptophanyl-tRNA synthetase